MLSIPQSVTLRVPLQAYLSTDHVSAATGKTIAITISKNGGAYGNPSGGATNATEIANGSYYVDLSTTDTGTTGPLFVRGAVSGIDDVIAIYNVAKATNGGWTALPDTACTTNASLVTSGTGTDQLSVTSGRIDIGKALGTAVTLDSNNVLNVSAKYLAGTVLTARDIGASVLLSAGTGTGQLDFTSGVVKANATQWLGGTIPAVNVTGVPLVDLKYSLGTAVTLDSNNVLNVSAKYLAGTVLTARDIGASVLLSAGTGTGQLDFTSGVVKANATQWLGGTIPAVNVTGVPLVDVKYFLGTISAAAAGKVYVDGASPLTESYAAAGAAFTLSQALYGLNQMLNQKSISGTTVTIKKRDGTTTAKTLTLNNAATPTSISETT